MSSFEKLTNKNPHFICCCCSYFILWTLFTFVLLSTHFPSLAQTHNRKAKHGFIMLFFRHLILARSTMPRFFTRFSYSNLLLWSKLLHLNDRKLLLKRLSLSCLRLNLQCNIEYRTEIQSLSNRSYEMSKVVYHVIL